MEFFSYVNRDENFLKIEEKSRDFSSMEEKYFQLLFANFRFHTRKRNSEVLLRVEHHAMY